MNKHLRLLTTVLVFAASHGMAGELAFAEQETPAATIYNLQLRDETGVRTIWSRQVALINGKKPYDWCSLSSWAQNEHGLLAIVYYNEFWGRLLQFNSSGKLIAEIEIGSKWLDHKKRFEKIHIEPPDKITVSTSKGIITEVIIRDGKLYNPDGEPFVEDPLFAKLVEQQRQASKAARVSGSRVVHPLPPAATATPSPARNVPEPTIGSGPPASMPWTTVAACSMPVIALLWYLLKRRK